MNKQTMWLVAGVLGLLLIAGGFWAYDFVLGDTEEASGPISAVPLEIETGAQPEEAEPTAAAEEAPTAVPAAEPTAVPDEEPTALPEEEGTRVPEEEVTAVPPEEPTAVPEEAPTAIPAEETAPEGLTIYTISQELSQASFEIYEELAGDPVDVLGVTDQVAGEVAIDLADLSATQVGVIQVNARTLATDSDRRNQAIRNRILNTDAYEFITFEPVAGPVAGLSGAAAVGDSFAFQIPGSLTIRDVSNPVTFEVTAEVVAPGRIEGTAVAVVLRDDYGLVIPSVPSVANVGEEVTIAINFTLVSSEG